MRVTRRSAAATARKGLKKWEKPLTPKYESDNIFAKILRGDAPCVKVYEDDVSLAFMDVMPRIEGHTLVIPKAPARTLFDLDPDDLALLMPAVQKVGRAVMVGMKAEGLLLQQFNEAASGQQVFHLHFHLLPCWTGVAIRPPGGPFQSAETLKPHADKIIAALAHG
jgi:histidine triad (HIT) family protein